MTRELPLPEFFAPDRVGEIYRVDYQARFRDAIRYRDRHGIEPAASDESRVGLLLVDAQNTFCIPGFELFVAGRSGSGAVEDNGRLCRFIYENLGRLTRIHATLDTHTAGQIFHSMFLLDESGEHPPPMTAVTLSDVESGRIRLNPRVKEAFGVGDGHLVHYCRELSRRGRYSLMVWPYHAMLGGIGHALVSALEEALFFHNVARASQTGFEIKGGNPLTESYSVLGPEVLVSDEGAPIAKKNTRLVEELLGYDALLIAGQAKSHCVAWTVSDLLDEIRSRDETLARRVFLLSDCTSPVVVPGSADFTSDADAAFQEFAESGMNVVRSTESMEEWLPTGS